MTARPPLPSPWYRAVIQPNVSIHPSTRRQKKSSVLGFDRSYRYVAHPTTRQPSPPLIACNRLEARAERLQLWARVAGLSWTPPKLARASSGTCLTTAMTPSNASKLGIHVLSMASSFRPVSFRPSLSWMRGTVCSKQRSSGGTHYKMCNALTASKMPHCHAWGVQLQTDSVCFRATWV